ncbi:MAG: hypothetical protein JSV03_01230 [Planctomycetota bacterium]|nr:MAG: hypothetical protein JSV03_01230 [Planctomycetota bacterium]
MAFLEKFWFGCGHRHGQETCPLADAAERSSHPGLEHYQGRKLAAAAGVVFLLPMLIAIAGAYLAGELWAQESFASLGWWQTGGAFAGFILGVIAAKLLLAAITGRPSVNGGHTK